ncbi:MAG: hypothetical protein A2173_11930 [Planctomycetes bacterium RBG_13_44_8b]|nr:MAG: hypothetical protein A2173_11930 [Planctomycetes bacterium RBG_13_44_8b]
MGADQRIERRISCFDIIAKVESNGLIHEGRIRNITRHGACINKRIDAAEPVNVILSKKTDESFYSIRERACQLIQHENGLNTGMHFADRLTSDEMVLLGLA